MRKQKLTCAVNNFDTGFLGYTLNPVRKENF